MLGFVLMMILDVSLGWCKGSRRSPNRRIVRLLAAHRPCTGACQSADLHASTCIPTPGASYSQHTIRRRIRLPCASTRSPQLTLSLFKTSLHTIPWRPHSDAGKSKNPVP